MIILGKTSLFPHPDLYIIKQDKISEIESALVKISRGAYQCKIKAVGWGRCVSLIFRGKLPARWSTDLWFSPVLQAEGSGM